MNACSLIQQRVLYLHVINVTLFKSILMQRPSTFESYMMKNMGDLIQKVNYIYEHIHVCVSNAEVQAIEEPTQKVEEIDDSSESSAETKKLRGVLDGLLESLRTDMHENEGPKSKRSGDIQGRLPVATMGSKIAGQNARTRKDVQITKPENQNEDQEGKRRQKGSLGTTVKPHRRVRNMSTIREKVEIRANTTASSVNMFDPFRLANNDNFVQFKEWHEETKTMSM